MNTKFAWLLKDDASWIVYYQSRPYTAKNVRSILARNIEKWKTHNILPQNLDRYIVVIGSNSFHFFLYTLIASILNMKIIFATQKQFKQFSSCYDVLNYHMVISTRPMKILNKKNVVLSTRISDQFVCYQDLNIDNSKQAEIIFCTSGTTGQPKLARYLEKKLYDNAKMVGLYMEINDQEKALCLFPFQYMYGFSVTNSVLIRNGHVFFADASCFTGKAILSLIKEKNITLLPIVRTILSDILKSVKAEYFDNLKIINASDKIYVHLVEKALKICPIFFNNMGQTESGPRLFSIKITARETSANYSYRNIVAVGYPVPGVKVKIINNSGEQCRPNEVGSLYYKTIYAMEGYLHQVDKNKLDDGWTISGDLAFQDNNGMVYWVGRTAQVIKINGFFVNINLLQNHFESLPFVRACCFISDHAESLSGFFEINHSQIKTKDTTHYIEAEFRKKFSLYPRLKKVIFFDRLPMTPGKKIDICKLNKLAQSAQQNKALSS